jgi:hypothetical protein
MRTQYRAGVAVAVVLLIIAAAAWVHARMASDDRPPIIVRGGSLSFEGGDPNSADAKDCCNNWKKDLLSDEWKPDPDNKEGVREFAVTVEGVPTVCSMSEARGEQVFIYFQYGPRREQDYSLYRVQIEAKGGFGKREPKINPPRKLAVHNGGSARDPGTLKDERDGFISGVRVGGAACGFDETQKHDLAIRIQPKIDR